MRSDFSLNKYFWYSSTILYSINLMYIVKNDKQGAWSERCLSCAIVDAYRKSCTKWSAVSRRSAVDKKESKRCLSCAIVDAYRKSCPKWSAVSRRLAVGKKRERKMPLMRGHAYRKSVQIDAVPFELPLEKIIDAVSREGTNCEGERIVKANEL